MRKDAFVLILLVLGALFIAGCQPQPAASNETGITYPVELENLSIGTNNSVPEETKTTETPKEETAPMTGVVIEATEGDLVQLKPEAIDPDKDTITYYFSKPFDEKGKWQTREGDAGRYAVTVTASDGKANTSEDITVMIKKAKKGPVIECPDSINVKEGDTIKLNCNIYDPEGDQAIIEYSGFMKGPTYTTTFNDAGDYTTVVKAKNKYKETQKIVKIKVLNTNRAPEVTFDFGDELNAMEGDIITLSPKVSDPDGDKATVKYSEPFDSTGVWKTEIGDAGKYTVSVVASDGTLTYKKEATLEIKMKNTAPVLKKINDITVYEGDTIKLPIDVVDREGNKVSVTVKGWMNSQTYTTTYEDAGTYTVTVIANDGQYEASQTFKVTVLDKNRPPVFKIPA
jgi:hypothetical protein